MIYPLHSKTVGKMNKMTTCQQIALFSLGTFPLVPFAVSYFCTLFILFLFFPPWNSLCWPFINLSIPCTFCSCLDHSQSKGVYLIYKLSTVSKCGSVYLMSKRLSFYWRSALLNLVWLKSTICQVSEESSGWNMDQKHNQYKINYNTKPSDNKSQI